MNDNIHLPPSRNLEAEIDQLKAEVKTMAVGQLINTEISAVAFATVKEAADVNKDGKVDVGDVKAVVRTVKNTDWDLNGDGVKDWKDIVFAFSKVGTFLKNFAIWGAIGFGLLMLFKDNNAFVISLLSVMGTQFFNILKDAFSSPEGKIKSLQKILVEKDNKIVELQTELKYKK
jgi:hypothetical protein